MKKILAYTTLLFLAACGSSDDKPKVEEKPAAPLTKSKNSEIFNASFGKLVNDYYALKDNFFTEDEAKINEYANLIIADVDSLKFAELKGDTTIITTAKDFAKNLLNNAKNILAAKTLVDKRKAFNAVSNELYTLVQTVQYDKAIIYHQHCGMAFEDGDANAFWLSKESNIKNPYLPKKMPECGDVVDSLDYSK